MAIIDALSSRGGPVLERAEVKPAADAGGFEGALTDAMSKVDGALAQADRSVQAALVEDAEPHEAMIALTKADLAFRMLAQTRNKVVDAYRELMRLQM